MAQRVDNSSLGTLVRPITNTWWRNAFVIENKASLECKV